MTYIWIMYLLICFVNVANAKPVAIPQEFYKDHPKLDQCRGFDPFISRVDFRNMADYVIDQSTEYFDPDWIRQGDIIMIEG